MDEDDPHRDAQVLRPMPARVVARQRHGLPPLRINVLLKRARGQTPQRAMHGRQDEQRADVARGMDNARHV